MKVISLYSHRTSQAENAGKSDVYSYDEIPEKLVNQIMMIWDDAIGFYYIYRGGYSETPHNSNELWKYIIKTIGREYGEVSFPGEGGREKCRNFLSSHRSVYEKLDIIELSFKVVDTMLRDINDFVRKQKKISMKPDDAINELNYRFREASVGYQFENGELVRVDSEFVHAEVVKNVLSLLHDKRFSGAEDEFLAAHTHYRRREFKDAIVDAGAAFESLMKCICDIRGWNYKKGARASDLIKVLRNNFLFPTYLDASFDQLLALLKSGLPEVRNNEGSHGQGSEPKMVPQHVAGYALHQAATNMVFLVDCMNALEE